MIILRWVITVFITFVVLAFTLSNLEQVDVQLLPFTPSYTLPLYFVILGSVSLGFLWGALLVWMNAYAQRRDGKKAQKKLSKLEHDLEEEREKKMAARTSYAVHPSEETDKSCDYLIADKRSDS